ncbi:MAG: HPr kinase/phosphorylase [Rhizobiaceae bacterium]|nr:MAG: HPr kinase/phosphorylase [Rhizobiaceae bacterium]
MMQAPAERNPRNHHATVVLLGDRGIMVRGPSGSGKTALALALLDRCKALNRFGRLVSDDQVLLHGSGGRIVAEAPPAIVGLVELRGFGPARTPFESRAVIDLVVDLVEPALAPRFQPEETISLLGVAVPRLTIDATTGPLALHVIVARLREKTYLERDFER